MSPTGQLPRAVRIDAHQHFWLYSAKDFPWIDRDMAELRRNWLPANLRPLLDARDIQACIAVQARADETETDFLLAVARDNPWVAGVVGWVDLRADDLDARLDRWTGSPALVGFRHLLQDERDVAATLADPDFSRGVARLQGRRLVYELLVRGPEQLALLPKFCARHDQHWLVLDHIGKPAIGGDSDARWAAAIKGLARLPHVACKLSGVVTEVVHPAIDEAQIHRYLDTVLDAFGPERLMFGSDWPVCLLRADYDAVCAIVDHWADRALSDDERARLWGGNAVHIYDLQRSPHEP